MNIKITTPEDLFLADLILKADILSKEDMAEGAKKR
jgi:hypothetical protein